MAQQKIPKHLRRNDPFRCEPINKISAMGISYKEPHIVDFIERKISTIEMILYNFENIENSILTIKKADEKILKLINRFEIRNTYKTIKKENKNLSEKQIISQLKNEIKKRNAFYAQRIIELANKNIQEKCLIVLSTIESEIKNHRKIDVLKNICIEHINKIEKIHKKNESIPEYIKKIKKFVGITSQLHQELPD